MENTKLSPADFQLRRVKNDLETLKESVWKCQMKKTKLEAWAIGYNVRNARDSEDYEDYEERQPETGTCDDLLADYAGSIRQLVNAFCNWKTAEYGFLQAVNRAGLTPQERTAVILKESEGVS